MRAFRRGDADVAGEFIFGPDFLFRAVKQIDDGAGAF